MSKTLQFVVPEEAKGMRLDKFLSEKIDFLSRAQIQEFIKQELISSPHNALAKNLKIVPNLVIDVVLPDETSSDLTPWDGELDIIFEDEHLIAINKPAGMVVHPGSNTGDDTLVHALLHHCGKENISSIGAPERPGIVHRLDKDTSGVIICAKNDKTHHRLTKLFANRELYKEYLALVSGVPRLRSGSIKEPIDRHPQHRTKMAVIETGKAAHTDWTFLKTSELRISLFRCVIHTGRTHQIRVHMQHLGHSILGDKTYGYHPSSIRGEIEPQRVMLHAHRLKLKHPITEEDLDLQCNPPADFTEIENQLSSV